MSRAIVFVHGILSSCEKCFGVLTSSLSTDDRFDGWTRLWFDYDYHDPIADNADKLVDFLLTYKDDPFDHIAMVGHSMGGLVARRAILSGRLPHVRKLIMLGTPNFGAFHTSRSPLLMQATLLTAGYISSLFRRPGILELTRVTEVMKSAVAQGAAHAQDVDYATIAGTYFNDARGHLEGWRAALNSPMPLFFKTLELAVESSALVPLWQPALKRPHDGIVESFSCSMLTPGPGRRSEKDGAINHPDDFGQTYVHIFDDDCDELMHVTLQSNQHIIDLVKGLLLADTLPVWRRSIPKEMLRRLKIEPDLRRQAPAPSDREGI